MHRAFPGEATVPIPDGAAGGAQGWGPTHTATQTHSSGEGICITVATTSTTPTVTLTQVVVVTQYTTVKLILGFYLFSVLVFLVKNKKHAHQ